MSQPWDFSTARQNCARAAVAQEQAESAFKDAAKDFALKEEAYRKALAVEIVKAHADGVAWSTAPDLARGDDTVARLRRERDIAEGVKEALSSAQWRHTANRKDTQRFADWSMRRELAEGYGQALEPKYETPIGARS